MELRLPTFALSSLTLNDFIVGMIFLALPQVPLTLGNHAYALHSGRHGRRGRAWAQRRHARICDQARLSQAPSWTAHRSLDADSDDWMFGDLHGLKLRVAGTEQQLRVIMLVPCAHRQHCDAPRLGSLSECHGQAAARSCDLSSTPKPAATSAPAGTQIKGRAGVFSHYRLRVAGVIRDYGMSERHEQAPKDSASVTRG